MDSPQSPDRQITQYMLLTPFSEGFDLLSAMTASAILTVKQYDRPRGANPVPKFVVFEDYSG